MNIPITTVGSQVYVQFPPATAPFSNISSSNQDDVHICGGCKQNFSDINLFVEHKRTNCIINSHKTAATASTLLGQPALSYISTGTEDSTSPLGPPIFRVIVDGSNLSVQPDTGATPKQAVAPRENGDSNILRSRLLGIQNDPPVSAVQQQSISSNSTGMQALVMQQPPRREFQIDEEAVATILANQLASEEVSPHNNLSPSRSDLDPITLSGEAGMSLEIQADGKHNSNNKSVSSDNGESDTSQIINHASRKPVTREAKDELWAHASGKNMNELTEQIHVLPGSITSIKEKKSSLSRPREKKRHDCTFDGCGEKPFRCNTCQRAFSRGDKLQMHLRIHSGLKPHRCEQCGYATIDSGSLRKHMRIHNDERPYKCQICPYRSRDSSQLTVHLRTHTGDNPFICPFDGCTSAFKTSSDLKRHSRMHTGEKPFACEICDYKCAIKSNLRVHLRLNHTEVNPIPCNSCSHVSTSKRGAKEHEKVHADEVLKCGVCEYTCISPSSMKNHLRTHTQEKHFSCKHCSYSCKVQGYLKAHIKKKHPEIRANKKAKNAGKDLMSGKVGSCVRVVPKTIAHSKPYCYKSYRCTSCDAAFVREDSWRSHMRQHQAQECIIPDILDENGIGQGMVSQLVDDEQQRIVETNNPPPVIDSLENEQFMISLDNQNQQPKDPLKINKNSGKSRDLPGLAESVAKDKEKVGQLVQPSDQDSTQPLLLYVQSPPMPENVDDSLRNAEILASLNQGAPILLAGRCGQYIIPTDQSIIEQLAATLQPGTTYQYILSSPLEGVVNDGSFIHAASSSDSELTTHVDAGVHVSSIISLHMDKQSLVEDKN
ncbi:hypothetical protein C0J52_07267 [Blattella germanica]|nr:hypothetical protein C0J52_07267 [Blattella germanica]